jgi:hypothetical protein
MVNSTKRSTSGASGDGGKSSARAVHEPRFATGVLAW